MFVGASAFADSRPSQETWRGGDRTSNDSNRTYRNNERVTVHGRVQSFNRERGGYRVQLDRGGYAFWIPDSRMRRGFDIRVGIDISLGGIFRDNAIYVDSVDYGSGYGANRADYRDDYVRGTVVRVDYRSRTLWLREDRTGRVINVDMRATSRGSRIDLNDLRRGDRVSLSGDWSRGGVFRAVEIASVRTGRY
jgi:hypothetical protein